MAYVVQGLGRKARRRGGIVSSYFLVVDPEEEVRKIWARKEAQHQRLEQAADNARWVLMVAVVVLCPWLSDVHAEYCPRLSFIVSECRMSTKSTVHVVYPQRKFDQAGLHMLLTRKWKH